MLKILSNSKICLNFKKNQKYLWWTIDFFEKWIYI